MSRSRVTHLHLLIVAILSAAAQNPAAAELILTLNGPTLTVKGAQAGSEVLLASASRRHSELGVERHLVATQSEVDSDLDGSVSFTFGNAPEQGAFVAIDIETGDLGAAVLSTGFGFIDPSLISVDEVNLTISAPVRTGLLVWVTPTSGAWAGHVADGKLDDLDGGKRGEVEWPLDVLEPSVLQTKTQGPTVAAAQADDVAVIINRETYSIGIVELKGGQQ